MLTIFPHCESGESLQLEVTPTIFPDGTSQVFLPHRVQTAADHLTIQWRFEGDEREIMDLASVRTGLESFLLTLELPYLPYARQDKKVTYKTASTFNLAAFAMLINAMKFHEVVVHEAHNIEETLRLINHCRIVHEPFHSPHLISSPEATSSTTKTLTTVVFPDRGAWTRYGKNEELQGFPTIVFDKHRHQETGVILKSSANMHAWHESHLGDNSHHHYVFQIVDDLVDGGNSFTRCSRYIRSWMSKQMPDVPATQIKVYLEVIHGVLSQGEPVPGIDGLIIHHRLNHPCHHNPLLHTDGYKLAHMEQYPPQTEYMYSYMIARSSRKYDRVSFFGLQYYLLHYLQGRVTRQMVNEFFATRESLLGPTSDLLRAQMEQLITLEYLPLHIKAVPEGSAVTLGNVLVTVTNTEPGFFWLVGLVESLLLKVWYTCTVATYSRTMRKLCEKYALQSCDNKDHVAYQIHDFGYRGASSEETAALGGVAHLLHFKGTDTVPSIAFVKKWYGVKPGTQIGATVPGSEHSVMCSYGRDHELDAYQRFLEVYPEGNVSIVSDTYNYWNVLTVILPQLREKIMDRNGRVIIRPDSGNPELILLGDSTQSDQASPEYLGSLRLLDRTFGSTINSKGLKVLHPSIGIIYGDGMYFDRIERILKGCIELGYATSNLVFGCGGILLQSHSRDDLGFAFKATSVTIDGQRKPIFKDPITDHSKKSHRGLLRLEHDEISGNWVTLDNQTEKQEQEGELRTVFHNGVVYRHDEFEQIVDRAALQIQ